MVARGRLSVSALTTRQELRVGMAQSRRRREQRPRSAEKYS